MNIDRCLAGLALALVSHLATADEATVRRTMAAVNPQARIESVVPSPVPGLFEVFADGEILYVDAAGKVLIPGPLVDAATRMNLTQARKDQLLAVPFAQLPLELAVKTVRGNGRRIFASFEDPNCPYCRQLHATLDGMTDFTLYTFLVPILGPESEDKVRGIWCSADRSAALRDVFADRSTTAGTACDVPMQRLVDLAEKVRVQGTPTLIFSDGTRAGGALPSARLQERLDLTLRR